jgi:hypothetical protein
MGGNVELWSNVVKAGEMWRDYANINFEWVGETDRAMVRIAFMEKQGSWSYLGKDALSIPHTRPTMNYGWFSKDTPWQEFRRTTVHEFGHMLGMIHEHQSPVATIQWNKEKVYKAYADSMGWTREMVDTQLFTRYKEVETQHSDFDPDSIMCYHIARELTIDGFTNGWNTDLSRLDKLWAGIIYPGKKHNVWLPEIRT